MTRKPRLRISRRRFLQFSALPAGAAAVPACGSDAGDPTLDGGGGDDGPLDVAVIGGGISGLVTARELIAAGFERVRVIEARDRVGGRTLNQPVAGDAVVEAGGQWVGPGQTEILGLIDELGLSTFLTYNTGDTVIYFSGFRFTGSGDFLEPNERADFDQAVSLLESLADTVPLDAPWTAPRADEWDAMSVADWLDGNVTTQGARAEFEGAIGSTLAATASDVSLLYFLYLLHGAGGYARLENIAGGAQESRVVGGSQLISIRIAEELGDRLLLDSPVAGIRHSDDLVSIDLQNGDVVNAKRVVVAMMPADTKRIAFTPALPEARAGLVDGWRGGSGFKAHLVYDTPFWRDDGLSGQGVTDGVVEITFDNSPPSGTPGVLLVFADPARLPSDSDGRRDALANALAPVFGDSARNPIDYVDLNWDDEEHTAGCVSPMPPQLLTSFGSALADPVGRIHWAGAETSGVWNGYMDGAVRAGKRAAAEVIALL